ncbi:MAG: 2-C-methyl-D-erythritol 4-phosphate cytidylyltransferase [Solirubrobacterales bacterium]|nr:2-C-methyl-D-erythritol 4-phosphate cytidylyltransferase [Solirubrobacterales bacterium]
MIEWSIDAFRACGSVRRIVVATPPGHAHRLGGADLGIVSGAATRAQSVANALATVDTALVAIHDAARPLLTAELVEALVARLDEAPEAAGVIAAAPVTDTIKRVAAESVGETLDRSELWAAQTPQLFRTEPLRKALASSPSPEQATDEAMLVERAGGTVLIHPCGPENLKVTTRLDLRVAELLLAERSVAQQ